MCKEKMGCGTWSISKIILIIGAVNWGLVGIGMIANFNLNLVNLAFGSMVWVESIVYVIVGIAGVLTVFGCKCDSCGTTGSCETCEPDCSKCAAPEVKPVDNNTPSNTEPTA